MIPSGTPFRTFHIIVAAMEAAMSQPTAQLRNFAMANIEPYKSRGKGSSHPGASTLRKATRGMNSSKYQPHQGKQEIARRMRGAAPVIPRRMWSITLRDTLRVVDSRRTPLVKLRLNEPVILTGGAI